MTLLTWDSVGEKRYQTGIDRGVLYPTTGDAVSWNGLVSVTENTDREIKSYYADGVKYLDKQVPGSFEASLACFTYPDELDELLGVSAFAPGVFLHDQRADTFGLSYRTKVGNDVDGLAHGYKIHILWNVMASISATAFQSLSASPVVNPFSFALAGTPENMSGIRPTSHLSLDSRLIDPDLLETIEALLYGTALLDPALPTIVELLALIEAA